MNHPPLAPAASTGNPENNHAARRKSPAAILTEEEIAALVGPGAPETEPADRLLRVLLAFVILCLGLTLAYLWHTRPVLQPKPEAQTSPEMSLARTAMAQGRHDQALRLLGVAAEKSGPGRLASINRFRAEVLLARAGRMIDSQPDLALTDITSAMGLAPKWPPGLLQAGRLLIRMERLEEARDAYLRALAINPRLDVGWFNLGYIYLQTGRYDRAAETFRRTIELDSALAADAYVNLAICQTRLGQQPEAEASLRQALSLNPNHQTAREYLSKLTGSEPKQ